MEHRWGHRHEVIQSVRIATHNGVIGRGRIRNISTSGAFVEADLPLQLFSRLRIQFNSALDGRPTVVEGQVVRKDIKGYGIEWRELAPEAVAALVVRPLSGTNTYTPRLVFRRPAAGGSTD
ncbi:MAG: PilZ domain-containing protein [Proteobacteria bacterium]|nr:PilZ domain-containing protein [Pseudomonadota bacterium]